MTGSGVATIVVNFVGAGYTGRGISVFTGTGLSSNLVKHIGGSGSSAATINVSAGDFLVGASIGSSNSTADTFTGSSPDTSPTSVAFVDSASAAVISAAYWNTITASNAAFAVTDTTAFFSDTFVASYR